MCRDANAYALASLRLQDSLPRVCFVLSWYLGSTKQGGDELLRIHRGITQIRDNEKSRAEVAGTMQHEQMLRTSEERRGTEGCCKEPVSHT